MKRREFVSAVGTIALAGSAGVFRRTKDRLDRIGLELYTVRDELARDFEGTLQRLAGLGYREVEFTDYFGRSVNAVRAAVATAGLTAPSAQVPSSELRTAYASRVDRAKAIGHTYLVCGWVSPAERRSLSDWHSLIALFKTVGQAAHRAGLQFAYHNHDFEFARVEGHVPYDLLLESTDPSLVQLELDVYWATKGGRNPVDLLARWPGRFPLLHLKDMASGPQHEFTELGRGIIDFRQILAQARTGGVRHFYVEQDEGRVPPFERARIGYDYLRALRF